MVVRCGSVLSHGYSRPYICVNKTAFFKYSINQKASTYRQTHSTMGSKEGDEHLWSALRVRNTFIEYFKERGHTFGMIAFNPQIKKLVLMRL